MNLSVRIKNAEEKVGVDLPEIDIVRTILDPDGKPRERLVRGENGHYQPVDETLNS